MFQTQVSIKNKVEYQNLQEQAYRKFIFFADILLQFLLENSTIIHCITGFEHMLLVMHHGRKVFKYRNLSDYLQLY